ncbi:hypothetical protein DMA10_18750 [Streptomyces sp. WAC 01420]|nr:hypothetical protein DLM49_26505 [Streptomyces sp. WAC 01438]RSM94416.1 hypothetical protein DMA10_18750 [Streptomyces sp. WAC 01420]
MTRSRRNSSSTGSPPSTPRMDKGLRLRGADGSPEDHVIPDGTLAPAELRLFRGADPWMPGEGIALVIEVTGTKPETDRKTKARCYARGGIPLYLLVDREASAITLFSDPEKDEYRERRTRPLGKPLSLPAPFSFDLDTADFL